MLDIEVSEVFEPVKATKTFSFVAFFLKLFSEALV